MKQNITVFKIPKIIKVKAATLRAEPEKLISPSLENLMSKPQIINIRFIILIDKKMIIKEEISGAFIFIPSCIKFQSSLENKLKKLFPALIIVKKEYPSRFFLLNTIIIVKRGYKNEPY